MSAPHDEASVSGRIELLPLRLAPGQDLRRALEAAVAARGVGAAFVVSGIGSLAQTRLRLAGAAEPLALDGEVEIVAMSGSVAPGASHVHGLVADAAGAVRGGHLGYGCTVRTTAEVLLALLPGWAFTREFDPATGYEELVIRGPAQA
jgi:predicted DNA-binding protein with PD1-like motif